uniref:Uncharacterized protein LOC111127066 n=1 Tax=Crassostrea virginica TaxID=6565 RepID=A0A8B8DIW3_CRAVI|nr:uncharacterized protein LOC111127066 [Crassostrea virginica]
MKRKVAEDDSVKNYLAENGCVKVFNPFLRHRRADDRNRPKDLRWDSTHDVADKAIKTFSSNDTVVTMLTTGDCKPYGNPSSASGGFLLCLRKEDQSKVVRYSSAGTMLQEIQFGSHCQPLYQVAWYIDENSNEDIVVSDYKKNAAIAVNGLRIFRYEYSGKHRDFNVHSIATDSIGHLFRTDFKGNKIHKLDRDGRFLRYIIPDGGIEHPRVVRIISVGEMIVGENKAVKTFSNNDTLVTMFTTGDWKPYGNTSSASGDFLLCLRKNDQSKVVRYSSTGTILQEIQYSSHYQPLYQVAWYIDENVNEDIVVSDYKKNAVIAVKGLGIFRCEYSGKHRDFSVRSIATDSIGHVFVADLKGNKMHLLDRDGRFLRYIIPDGGIEHPRAVCIICVGEMIVGESMTGVAKTIRFL